MSESQHQEMVNNVHCCILEPELTSLSCSVQTTLVCNDKELRKTSNPLNRKLVSENDWEC